ncbi:MAG: phosphate ABC transporter substrate-binding protein [Chloroflexota bacterium]
MSSRRSWLLLPVLFLAAVALIATSGCGGTQRITEAGSTTVQPVAEKLANAYMADHPDIEIVVQGGGSSTGVKSCNEGTVDIGAASRELKPDEPDLVEHLLARDGIAIAVHPSNPITELTTEEVKNVFAGTITSWSELGGADEDIIVVSREEGSGTRAAFEEMVMGEELITASAILQPSNGAVRTSVSTTPTSVGYLSFGYIDDTVKSLAVDGVEGTVENAKSGTYPIVRPLYFLTKEEPEGIVKDFIDFCLGAEGQDIVEDEGYIRVD